MTQRLPDGTVIPHGFKVTSQASRELHFDATLKVGQVTKGYPPSHKNNRSGSQWEYDVIAIQRDGVIGGRASVVYRNCTVMSLFGSMADRISFTLRAPSKENIEGIRETGSFVLLLCEGGNTQHAYIVGSPIHPAAAKPIDETHFLFEFNGATFYINEEGEVSLSRSSKVAADGKVDGPSAPARIHLGQDGSLYFGNTQGQELVLSENQITALSSQKITLDAQEVLFGNTDYAPILRGTDSYVSAVQNLNSTMKTLSADLKSLCSALASIPSAQAPASKVLATLQLLDLAIDQYDATISPGNAISEKTFTE